MPVVRSIVVRSVLRDVVIPTSDFCRKLERTADLCRWLFLTPHPEYKMIDARVFDDLSKTLGKMLPPGVADAKDDFERNARATLQSALGRLDLVTREEFDVQAEVLKNTRKQLKQLEERIRDLEGAPEPGGEPDSAS